MPPKRVDAFDVYEFQVVIAEDKGHFIAIGRDKRGTEVQRFTSINLDDARNEIRQVLSALSDDFVGYQGAINQFLRVYPKGFEDPFFLADERAYKLKAHEKAKILLGKEVLVEQIKNHKYSDVCASARKVFINLIFPNEGMAFKSFVERPKNAEAFCPRFFQLLYGLDFDSAFDDLSALLAPAGAAKWTILTYWPFILFPDRHVFMKPEVAQEAARRLGDSFDYQSRPSAAVYFKYLGFARRLRENISDLEPRDNIDIQTFMYAVGKSGFVREGEKQRREWELRRH